MNHLNALSIVRDQETLQATPLALVDELSPEQSNSTSFKYT
jgi:hypothetical protein